MKSTGIVRKVDELGRIVLPIELRRTLDIVEKDALEIYVDGSSAVMQRTSSTTRIRTSAAPACSSSRSFKHKSYLTIST